MNRTKKSLEVLAQLANAKIARSNVVTRVEPKTSQLCEFNFSGLPLHLKTKNK